MEARERINDILEGYSTIFNKDEIKYEGSSIGGFECFKSIEFHQIMHFTNEEYYYIDQSVYESFKEMADEMLPTKSGIIFCYK